MMYYWSLELPVTTVSEMLAISQKTAIQWYAYFREVCTNQLVAHPVQLGGPGHIVEIDETNIARRKYHRGRDISPRWIFGGVDRSTKIGFMEIVENDRSAEKLTPIIQRYIQPGTQINTDCWKAYFKIEDIPVNPKYQHRTVNHSKYFVDPITLTHTNSIESMWSKCKRKFKSMIGVHSTVLQSHLNEFMWRQQFGRTHTEAFRNIASHFSQYPPLKKNKK